MPAAMTRFYALAATFAAASAQTLGAAPAWLNYLNTSIPFSAGSGGFNCEILTSNRFFEWAAADVGRT